MALIKVTAATALPSVKQAIAELAKAVREAGALPGLEMVQQSLERLDSYCSGRTLDVELVVVSPLEPALGGRVAGWIGGGVPAAPLQTRGGDSVVVELAGSTGLVALRLRIRPITSSTALPAGTPRPALLVLLVGNVTGLHADNLALVERLLEERPVAVLLAPAAEDAVKRLEERSQALAWTTVRLDVTALSEPSLQARLAAAPWDALHELLRAHSALSALQSLNGVFDLALQQQARDLRTKKAAAQAKIGKAGPASAAKPTAPGSELIQEVKTRIQRHAQEFERGAVERLQDLLGLTGGTLARETEALLLSLDELDEREGTTKIETRIPHAFEQKLLKVVRERLVRHCAADVVALNDLLRLLGEEIERTLGQNQGPPFVPQFAYLGEDRVRRLLDMTLGLQAQYRGELPHEGFGEYFASVRKYSMILVMGASMFGMSSVMRQYREYTVPLTILLVITGTYNVISSTRRARVENLEKELEAARNALRPDLKRIFAEMQKGWSAILLQHMNEQINAVLADVETAVRDFHARRGAEASPEKERLQRQLMQIEAAEKKMPLLLKAQDTLETSLDGLRSELKPLFPRPGGAAPAARPAAAAPPAAQSAMEAARAKIEALKAAAAAKAPAVPAPRPAVPAAKPAEPAATTPVTPAALAAPTKPSALEEAKARLAAMRAAPAEKKPAEPAKANALGDAKARFEALKKQAEERKAAAAARRGARRPPAPAAAAAVPTAAPAVPTAAPAVPTAAPAVPTAATPAAPSASPTEPAAAPAPAADTSQDAPGPADPTRGPSTP